MALTLLPVAAAQRPATVAQTVGGIPQITSATPGAGQVVVVKWSMPSGHTATNIHWSTNDATTPDDPESSAEGDPLTCWLNGPSDGKRACVGGRDLPDQAISFTIAGLAPGTYYVQVLTYGLKTIYINGNPGQYHYNAYSTPYKLVVPPSVKGGGGTSGDGSSGEAAVDTMVVTATTEIVHKDGTRQTVPGGSRAVLVSGDAIRAGKQALRLAVKEGRLVLAPHSELEIEAPDVKGQPPDWFLRRGVAWFEGKRYSVVTQTAVAP